VECTRRKYAREHTRGRVHVEGVYEHERLRVTARKNRIGIKRRKEQERKV
jgi:hypothetical protein